MIDWLFSRTPDFYIAVFTIATFASITGQLLAMRRSNEHFRVTERAYVKLSHMPPGIIWVRQGGYCHAVLSFRVKNFGHTPAHVTDAHFEPIFLAQDEKLPDAPEYTLLEGRSVTAAFLVADDEMVHRADIGILHAQHTAVMDETSRLVIIGYVDYLDKFGIRHRGSYAREYEPGMDQPPANINAAPDFAKRNNLVIVSERLYNDDRPRSRGEDVDW